MVNRNQTNFAVTIAILSMGVLLMPGELNFSAKILLVTLGVLASPLLDYLERGLRCKCDQKQYCNTEKVLV